MPFSSREKSETLVLVQIFSCNVIHATKAKAIISKCNFLFRKYPKQSYSFYKCNFYNRLLEYMTHILSAKIPHFNLKFQCLCVCSANIREKKKKEKRNPLRWTLFLSIKKFISRHSSKNADEPIVESSKNEGKSLSLKIFPPKLFSFFFEV